MKQTHRPPRSIYPAQNRHMRRRTRVLAGLVAVLCFGGLLARLFTLQILDPSGYANRAAAQQLVPCIIAAVNVHTPQRFLRRGHYKGLHYFFPLNAVLPRPLALPVLVVAGR